MKSFKRINALHLLPALSSNLLMGRAIVQKDSKEFIGIVGYVPCLDRFEQLSDFDQTDKPASQSLATSEFGLFYAISKPFQGFGFTTEAALAMTTYAFEHLHVKRIIATTTYDIVLLQLQ